MILERPRVKLPPPWFRKETLNKLCSAQSLDMKNALIVRPGFDQDSAQTRDEKCK